jgi:hypothetical protein
VKDFKQKSILISIWDFEGNSLEEVITHLRNLSKGLTDPAIVVDQNYDDVSAYIRGWVPMTEREKENEKKRLEKEKLKKKIFESKKMEAEIALLDTLAAKYNKVVR